MVSERRCAIGVCAARDQFLGILVAQLIEREAAAPGHGERLGERLGRIDARQLLAAAQVAFAVRRKREAGLGHARAEADGGERVGERAACARVHAHTACRRERQAAACGAVAHRGGAAPVVRAGMQLEQHPQPFPEDLRQCRRQRLRHLRERVFARFEQGEAAGHAARDILQREGIQAFARPPAAGGDQLGEVAVAFAVGGKQYQLRGRRRAAGRCSAKREFGADDQLQAALLRRQVGAHCAGHRALVGDRERRIAERMRALDQFIRVRGAAQEAEIAQAVKFGVAGRGVGDRHERYV